MFLKLNNMITIIIVIIIITVIIIIMIIIILNNTSLSTTYQSILLSVSADVLEVADNESHQVRAHLHTHFVIVSQKRPFQADRPSARHIEQGDVPRLPYNGQAEVGLEVRLVETREGSSGVRWLKVSGGYLPVGGRHRN